MRKLDGRPYTSRRAIALHERADRKQDPVRRKLRREARRVERSARSRPAGGDGPLELRKMLSL